MPRGALALFFSTGASALVLQTVWLRMLIRAFGVTVWATTTVVAVFMAGLALGAWLASRSADTRPGLVRWGRVELLVAASALLASVAIAFLPTLWSALVPVERGPSLAAVRVVLTAACLLPPTTLMGMTLPLLVAAWPQRRALSVLYGINTLGAVTGAIAVGVALLAAVGERGSLAIALSLNVAAGVTALVLARRPAPDASAPVDPPGAGPSAVGAEPLQPADAAKDGPPVAVVLAAALGIGFVMLGLEIAWTRLLIFIVGSSTYAFTAMIAMYLAGIGLGGLFAARRPRVHPATIASVVLFLATLAVLSLHAFGALAAARTDALYTYSPLTGIRDVIAFYLLSAVVVSPATFASGMLFPWLAALCADNGGRAAGRMYAANAVGSVLGALAVGFGAIQVFGPWGTVFVLATLAALIGLGFALLSRTLRRVPVLGAAAISVVVFATAPVDDAIAKVVAARANAIGFSVVRHVDAVDSTVSVLHPLEGNPTGKTLMINSIITSTVSDASALMAHLPLALQDAPASALIICFGVGGTFSSATQHVDEVHGVELVADVVQAFPLFDGDPALLTARKNRVFIDDGRNHLLASRQRYDTIVIDAAPPMYGAGTVNLYTAEMMTLVAEHLTETGVFLLWLPTHTWREDVWAAIRGVTDAFRHTAIIASTGSGIVVLGGHGPLDLDVARARARMGSRPRVSAQAVDGVTFALTPSQDVRIVLDAQVRRQAARFPVLTDNRPLTEFPLVHLLRGDPLVRRGIDFLDAIE